MLFISRQYARSRRELAVRPDLIVDAPHREERVVVPIPGLNRSVVQAVNVARSISEDVRAVYVDRGGRLIFLDQQRVRAGQADLPSTPQARRNGELRWMSGQVLIVLQGDLPTDSLRFIARHVR